MTFGSAQVVGSADAFAYQEAPPGSSEKEFESRGDFLDDAVYEKGAKYQSENQPCAHEGRPQLIEPAEECA